MCSCTLRRSSAISRCASLESSWVSEKEVTPWMQVAAENRQHQRHQQPDLVLADDVVHQDLRGAGQHQAGQPC